MTQHVPTIPLAPLTRDEAQILTDRIRNTADELWALLLEAHGRQAWKPLHYSSWRNYAKWGYVLDSSSPNR